MYYLLDFVQKSAYQRTLFASAAATETSLTYRRFQSNGRTSYKTCTRHIQFYREKYAHVAPGLRGTHYVVSGLNGLSKMNILVLFYKLLTTFLPNVRSVEMATIGQ